MAVAVGARRLVDSLARRALAGGEWDDAGLEATVYAVVSWAGRPTKWPLFLLFLSKVDDCIYREALRAFRENRCLLCWAPMRRGYALGTHIFRRASCNDSWALLARLLLTGRRGEARRLLTRIREAHGAPVPDCARDGTRG